MANPVGDFSNPLAGMDVARELISSMLGGFFQRKQRELNENASITTPGGAPLPDPAQTLGMYADIASLPVTNALNQINRIGGTDVPPWDPDLLYQDVFSNAGYSDVMSQILGMAAGVAEPGPGELAKLAFFLGGPTGLQRLLGSRIHPSLKDPLTGIPRQTGHGTGNTYDMPRAGGDGLFGRGHYTANVEPDSPAKTVLTPDPRFNDFTHVGSGEAPQVRLDTSVMENPFVRDGSNVHGMMTPARIRPSEPDIRNLREWMEYAAQYSADASRALDRMKLLDERVGAAGDAARMDYGEFRDLLSYAEDAMAKLKRVRSDIPDVNLTQLLSRAYGIDGLVSTGPRGEIVTFDPRRNVVNTVDSAVEVARRMGFTDDEIRAADPEAWRIFQEGTEWADPGSIPTLDSMQRWPLTELGEVAIPTRETLMEVAKKGGMRDVADWLRQLGVPDRHAQEVGQAAQMLADYGPDPLWEKELTDWLGRGYASITDPDTAADYMRVFDPPGPHSPLVDPRQGVSDRELSQLRPYDPEAYARAERSAVQPEIIEPEVYYDAPYRYEATPGLNIIPPEVKELPLERYPTFDQLTGVHRDRFWDAIVKSGVPEEDAEQWLKTHDFARLREMFEYAGYPDGLIQQMLEDTF